MISRREVKISMGECDLIEYYQICVPAVISICNTITGNKSAWKETGANKIVP